MGCCSSRPQTESTPTSISQNESRPVPTEAAPVINVQPGPPPSLPSTPSQRRLDEAINQPLRKHKWKAKRSRWWTRGAIQKERTEFFDTRVTNRPEIWSALQSVISLLDDGDFSTAQEILDASSITLPTGDLVDGAYDYFGNLYAIPEYVVSYPTNVIDDLTGLEAEEKLTASTSTKATASTGETQGQREIPAGEVIQVKARLSDRGGSGQDVVVTAGKDDSLRTIIEGIATLAGVNPSKIKIAYLGKILDPRRSIVAQGWKTGNVVNAMVAP